MGALYSCILGSSDLLLKVVSDCCRQNCEHGMYGRPCAASEARKFGTSITNSHVLPAGTWSSVEDACTAVSTYHPRYTASEARKFGTSITNSHVLPVGTWSSVEDACT